MKKLIYIFLLIVFSSESSVLKAHENETICSKRYNFCFQIPPNFFMLTTNDIESASVSYKTVDGSSIIEIVNRSMPQHDDFHKVYLKYLGQWIDMDYRITLKKEYNDFFVFSGYTKEGKGFYQKVIKINNDYASAYLEFPKGNKRYSNISQMIFDYFEKTILN